MKKISKIKEYAARYLYEVIGMEIENISKEIEVSKETLAVVLENSKQNANIKTVTSKTDSFINQTAVKGTKNVTIMTQNGSQLGDTSNKSTNSKFESFIYRPRG